MSGSPDMWRDLAVFFPCIFLLPQLFLGGLCVKVLILIFPFAFSASPCLRGEVLPGVFAIIFPGIFLRPQLFLDGLCVKVLVLIFPFVFSASPCCKPAVVGLRGEILPEVFA